MQVNIMNREPLSAFNSTKGNIKGCKCRNVTSDEKLQQMPQFPKTRNTSNLQNLEDQNLLIIFRPKIGYTFHKKFLSNENTFTLNTFAATQVIAEFCVHFTE